MRKSAAFFTHFRYFLIAFFLQCKSVLAIHLFNLGVVFPPSPHSKKSSFFIHSVKFLKKCAVNELSRMSKKYGTSELVWQKRKYDYVQVWQKISQFSHVWQYSVWLLNLRMTKKGMTIKLSFFGYDHFFELQVWQKKNQCPLIFKITLLCRLFLKMVPNFTVVVPYFWDLLSEFNFFPNKCKGIFV